MVPFLSGLCCSSQKIRRDTYLFSNIKLLKPSWIFKYIITKLYLFHTSAIFGHFLQTCNKKLTSKDISKSAASKIGLSNGFFLSLLLRSVNYEMYLCCLQILPKKTNENKSTWCIIVSNKVKNFHSFFGKIEDTKKSFWN